MEAIRIKAGRNGVAVCGCLVVSSLSCQRLPIWTASQCVPSSVNAPPLYDQKKLEDACRAFE